ncbi:outer membrane protein assembly factor BamA [Puniceibacterium sp. IMCC21224]|uniref:outer membrane protein assembly factor BamA n=1 Tax=Puniceibacterium sp. IMCC21224 TaxID=1618204 RepID=UPI00064DC6B7|nr:Beta-barrel assembly machine subunit BamA [Puniceibacterium sp. IMCC21224]
MTDTTFAGAARRTGTGRRLRHGASVFVLSISMGLTALPHIAGAQDYNFTDVTIEGNQRIEPGTILSYAGIGRGQTVSAAQLNDAYQRIFASGLFETVDIVPEGSRLVIKVVEFPTINTISFEGNNRIKDEDLTQVVQSQSRKVFNPSQAEADAAMITQAYVQAGRIAARVQPKVIRRSDNRVDLVFEVFEGGVTEVERIAFVGNQAYSDRRLRRVLETKQAGIFRAVIGSDTFIEDRLQFDQQVLQDFYSSRGYVDFRITGVNAELAQERNGYFVSFSVEEGQQFDFGEVTVSSDLSEVDVDAFQDALKLRSGVVYSPNQVDNEIARLERLAIRKGLSFVRVEPRVTRNDRDLTLDVEFLLTRGPRIFVERIDIEGNTTTLDRVIRRQFKVVEGDPFNPREIRESAERIRALGFFSNAEVEAREGSSPQQVIVDVNVEEQSTGSLSFGGSYSSSSGFGLAIEFRERNFLGRGQGLSLGFNTGTDNRSYTFTFSEPAVLGRDLKLGIGLSYEETDQDNAEYDTAIGRFSPSLTFPLAENSELSVRYSAKFSEISNPSSDIGALVTAEAALGQVWDSSVGYTYSYDTRRTGLDPNAGVLLEFGQDFGGLGGDTTFIKTNVRAVAQKLIWNEEVTIRATLEAGALNYSQGKSRVTDRFFMGTSVMRGFEYGGIGPREYGPGDIDDALGGNLFAVARFEAEFPLGLPEEYGISGGVFYDVGSLWGLDNTNSNVLYEDFSARHVIGFSLFWDTAIGPLRFNFSEALVKEKHDKPQSFELTVSTQF